MNQVADSFRAGLRHQEDGDYVSAVRRFREVPATSEDFILSRLSMGDCLIRLGDFEGALALSDDLLREPLLSRVKATAWLSFADENPYSIKLTACFHLKRLDEARAVWRRFESDAPLEFQEFSKRYAGTDSYRLAMNWLHSGSGSS